MSRASIDDLYLRVKAQCQVNAKSLSAIFVRQIGHSEQASEQDLHTAKNKPAVVMIRHDVQKG
jgi:hypothetical protein